MTRVYFCQDYTVHLPHYWIDEYDKRWYCLGWKAKL